ncbi:MAG: DUF2924 domain-containing protein [Proteobacteria bacterium]|nr:DUF2924 domain-containing protein [Pseudomonadota bacterium]
MKESLEARLTELPSLPRSALIEEFERVYRRSPPLRLSDRILALAVGYRLQEQVHGGPPAELRRRLLSDQPIAAPTRASPGTILIREWQGREYTVTVHPDHVEYDGQRYRSLTEVAYRITGQKRSGPLFFGLKQAATS